jgi:hypothetical protein
VGVKELTPEQQALLGQTFFLTTHADSGPETAHDATVIGVNLVGEDDLLFELTPPLPDGMYLSHHFKEDWRKSVKRFNKVLVLRRHGGYRVAPPGPTFPIVVHIYGWPEEPLQRTVSWNVPDDWGELHLSRESRGFLTGGTPLSPSFQFRESANCLLGSWRIALIGLVWLALVWFVNWLISLTK